MAQNRQRLVTYRRGFQKNGQRLKKTDVDLEKIGVDLEKRGKDWEKQAWI